MHRIAAWIARPAVQRRINGWAVVLWIIMIPVSLWLHLLSSVTYVSALSIWALVSTHLGAWVAARVGQHQEQDADVQDVINKLDE